MSHAKERAYRKERAARERERNRKVYEQIPGCFNHDPRVISILPGVFYCETRSGLP